MAVAEPLPALTPDPVADPGDRVCLSSLAPGAVAVVVSVDLASPAGRRLADLGFLPGTAISVLRRAPLGDPVSFYLRGTQLCLRRSEAEAVKVRVLREPSEAPR